MNRPASTEEPILEPHLPICDAHHHLWDRPDQRYLLPEFLADAASGHDLRSSVFVEWRSHYRDGVPEEMRPVGETEFAVTSVAERESGPPRACAAIVGYAALSLGAAVAPVLEAHLAAGRGRVKGVRNVATWDADPQVVGGPPVSTPELYRTKQFREGFALLTRYQLTFDAWVYQTQLGDLIDLARAFPYQPIVLNHTGGVLGVGKYATRRAQVFSSWRSSMQRLAQCQNVYVKLGGLGMRRSGFPFYGQPERCSSEIAATAWRPWLETCIEEFGPSRCMFESNFPVDAASCTYRVLWNAFKRVIAGASLADKTALLHDTAARFYRIA